jgi:hypothetical protein
VLRDEIATSRRAQWDLLHDLLVAYAEPGRPVRKVGIVGNAPLGPDAARVAELDSCDLVIRANSLVLDEPGAPPCLGRLCHVVLLSRNTVITPWVFQSYRRRLYLVMQTGFSLFRSVRERPDHWPADLGAMPLPNEIVTRPLVDLLAPDREPGTVIPTTGTTALFIARELFPEVERVATGFSFLEDRTQTAWSHHAGSRAPVDERHDLSLEGALLEQWADDGSIRFLR